MFLLYDLVFLVFAILYLPYLIVKRKWHGGFWARLGFFPRKLRTRLAVKRNIWIHAVSVGEVLSVAGLIEKLRIRFADYNVVLSTVTKTGYAVARSKLDEEVIVIYAPLDLSGIVKRYARVINPKLYILAETEIWPNLLRVLAKQKIPVIQINGRISRQAFRGYMRVGFIMKWILNSVNLFCMQSERDARRIVRLGAPLERVYVIGNLKFDDVSRETPLTFKDLGLNEQDEVWVAGSTHPGEEEILLDIFKELGAGFPNLRLIIAPRHSERALEIAKTIQAAGFHPVMFSQIRNRQLGKNDLVVVDTIGDLRSLYSLAKIVFVGKSLTVGGGQNILEPAFFKKPILIGPRMANFQDIVEIFCQNKALVQVKDAGELKEAMRRLLSDPPEMERLANAAKATIEKYQGATQKVLTIINDYLNA